MTDKMIDNRTEKFKQSINYQTVKLYGIRLNVGETKELSNNKYKVIFNYNKTFNIIDENTKTIFVRNIYFPNIYGTDIYMGEELKLPLTDINKAINDEFIDLRQSLFQKVITEKKIMIKILKNIHTTSAFLNKFYTIFNDLFYCDVIPKNKIKSYVDSDKKYLKYIELIIDAGLAEYTEDKNLKSSNKFKKLLEDNKKDTSFAIEEAISLILSQHYDYIVYELGIKHIKPYVNIIACMYYLRENMKLSKISININTLHRIYENLFDSKPYIKFQENVSSLIMSGIFSRTDNAVMLQY